MIFLRELTRSDLQNTLRWRQDPLLVENLGEPFRYINPETEAAWFEAYLQNRAQNVRLAICESETQTHIGNLNLTQIHAVHRSAEFSILIGEAEARGKNYGTLATRLGLKHAFEDLHLNRVYLQHREDNLAAHTLYLKTGFQVEGCLRQAYFKQGHYLNAVVMSILAEDYFRNSTSTC
ncbi:UDP-4-amino-4,6-dideoxy-N-acetyl-beta-L-altrosamine N-acetyltransferase [bacterium (Candidatus Blackallbacteria) CG17_big_fil_post_rev_8_21_14_2_50_48_46]|uniref:UDP-4-amino-4, 6-dideoxy-N-acetyl-beta-L-altrosamine N-acetyltransferase n=1 Tax=bacterium (Candidatus Blackallbacteria) CG17_big_fil_post_rev_8_21_14_2_50_48_46 TaxID=2014261 RepID=A0A2M7G678_9BACT|nr:MAG: UDP-4-amino-4,6-dideoxy-N-acetyl-beta-L-altrosamine N-acetyltransferase [bacterium (Candidatus Blackallbacteria) CG18_big_fil_WC_8_21_14_2_50_49_26]PIW17449.1 MAG: UDP-4-amino-4,6-dideoxy-N-acetyl-beta-L-altrosamine N-acetyltransferase [bacterium (Candidatus Blackallbacteria) CG17_big_fil_post_rev_8_21_14_2_50_48_46]PIW48303.1 MAG: UDP-4-amino-4,6-dideoxy-N-acetyl-beta-L-altrosamine N-acetyltransferase [bacterium (Candidatus Blackallbacteria) CG13_big_fil_rev_8_21_14_2_50_49_14]